jgi:hypothetical protein
MGWRGCTKASQKLHIWDAADILFMVARPEVVPGNGARAL